MDKSRILDALKTLQDELGSATQLDGEARAALLQATDEIHKALDADRSADAASDAGLSGKLNEAILGFEAEHPNLTRAVGRVASALADMGI